MASKRHILRSIVVQTIFAWEFHGMNEAERSANKEAEAILSYNIVNGAKGVDDTSFALALLQNVIQHQDELKETIQKYAPEWTWEKIAPMDRAILEVAVAELLFDSSVPALVAINEGIELAKEFGNENSSKFVNGVLSSLYEELKISTHASKN